MNLESLSGDAQPVLAGPFMASCGAPTDPREIAATLARGGRLTAFQAAKIEAGKSDELLLGEYVILDELGAGGMGRVYRAQHQRMKRIVALKIISPAALRDEQAQKRFQREVQAAAKLLHPNIVTAFDAGWANGQYYLAMEFISGRDLAAIVRAGGPLPIATAVNYVLQAARGLAFAHAKGIIHRDVKPANLLVDEAGVVKILDLGLARLDEPDAADDGLTQMGQVLGTAHYMAPEQALDVRAADARADVYSLGCSLYYLLTGENMYPAGGMTQVIIAHYERPIPDLRARGPAVSTELDAVFCRMVAKSPRERFQAMSQVIAALEGLDISGGTGVGLPARSLVRPDVLTNAEIPGTQDIRSLRTIIPGLKSERTRAFLARTAGATFATIVAPLVVAVMLRLYEQKEPATAPPAVPSSAAVATASEIADSTSAPTNRAPVAELAAVTSTNLAGSEQRVIMPSRAIAPFDAKKARAYQQAWASFHGIQPKQKNSLGMTLVLIPPGGFAMGSTPEQVEAARHITDDRPGKHANVRHFDQEMPKHRVALDRAFLLGATEVTIRQFGRFVEATEYVTDGERYNSRTDAQADHDDKKKLNWRDPGYSVADDMPVTQVTWSDAVQFCNWLSRRENLTPCYEEDGRHGWRLIEAASGYRLPTEAEWEFACRGGSSTLYAFGNDVGNLEQNGWYGKNAENHPRDVGTKRANQFGLFDMHGNVAEWCHDWFAAAYYAGSPHINPLGPATGNVHSIRGGSWRDALGSYCRSAFRADDASTRNGRCGFRVVRAVEPSQP